MSKPSKRTALAVLTLKRLAGLCDDFEIDRAGLTLKDDLIAVLARSKIASFDAILDALSRQELKAICRAHELDESGKEKSKLVARILGKEPAQVELLASVEEQDAEAAEKPKGAAKQAKRFRSTFASTTTIPARMTCSYSLVFGVR